MEYYVDIITNIGAWSTEHAMYAANYSDTRDWADGCKDNTCLSSVPVVTTLGYQSVPVVTTLDYQSVPVVTSLGYQSIPVVPTLGYQFVPVVTTMGYQSVPVVITLD